MNFLLFIEMLNYEENPYNLKEDHKFFAIGFIEFMK